MCVAEKCCEYETGSNAIMNSTVLEENNNFILAAGQNENCHVYKLKYKIQSPGKEKMGMSIISLKQCVPLSESL